MLAPGLGALRFHACSRNPADFGQNAGVHASTQQWETLLVLAQPLWSLIAIALDCLHEDLQMHSEIL